MDAARAEALVLDMPLEVVFDSVSEEITLPLFRPAADVAEAAETSR